jgi:hypothetical protein
VSQNLVGASVNASGTKIAAAKAIGTASLDTSKASLDSSTVVPHGSSVVDVKSAINMGLLRRNAAGALEELNPAQPYTRQG